MKTSTFKSKGIILPFAIVLISFTLVQCTYENHNKNGINEVTPKADALTQAANEINKRCPMMVDKDTQIDNVIYLPDNTFQYNYTLLNYKKSTTDTIELINYLTPVLLNQAKTNPGMKAFLATKVNLSYCYKDKSGIYLFRILLTPNQYENNDVSQTDQTKNIQEPIPNINPNRSEIDRLAAKYENTPQITISTSGENLYGKVNIDYNSENEPQTVRIEVQSSNKSAVEEFINLMIKQKKAKGFVSPENYTYDHMDFDLIEYVRGNSEVFLKKGNMIFKIYYGKSGTIFWFKMETTDYSRKAGKNKTNIDF